MGKPVKVGRVCCPSAGIGSASIGALAIGALAIGRLVIGRLLAKDVRINAMILDSLTVKNIAFPEKNKG